MKCKMVEQGYEPGKCATIMPDRSVKPACKAVLKKEKGLWYRVIKAAHLSRPEHYFSIYMSGCNHDCLKCHSAEFSQRFNGHWMSTEEIAEMVAEYEKNVTVWEPRERVTMWHATDLCRSCGSCILRGTRGPLCPNKLSVEQVVLSPQGFGPARNICAYTGGDLACCTEFYAQLTEKIKEQCKKMWVLFETNGFALTPENLDVLKAAGVDGFWLDIKAYSESVYRKLCGTSNKTVLDSPAEILDRGFVLEVLSLYIPGWVEIDELEKIASHLADVDPNIPFTLLAFFPAYKLKHVRSPTLHEMLKAYFTVKNYLKNVKLGNCHVFAKTEEDWKILIAMVGKETIG